MTTTAMERPVHVRTRFEFTIRAPRSRVAPLFGAHAERAWAEGWNPVFIHPHPPSDQAGAVFTVERGGHTSTWMTTRFEPGEGRIQHVYFVPQVMTTLIDIRLAEPEPATTRVEVVYERTALSAGHNGHLRALAEHDATVGETWRQEIERCLGTAP